MKAVILALAVLSSSLPGQAVREGDPRLACRDSCVSCSLRCASSKDKESCKRTCREIKLSCCTIAGKKPGAVNGCSCGS